jgi:hypothetical protein
MESPKTLTQIIRHFSNELRKTEAVIRREHKSEVNGQVDQVAADEFAKLTGSSSPEDYVAAQTAIKIAQTTIKANSKAVLAAKLEQARLDNASAMIAYQTELTTRVADAKKAHEERMAKAVAEGRAVKVEVKTDRVTMPS